MIANDPNNDEYKLDDLDLLASEPEELQPEAPSRGQATSMNTEIKPFWENPNIRKGLIVIAIIVGLLICYGLISSLFSSNQDDEIKPVTAPQRPVVMQQPAVAVTTTRFSEGQAETQTSKKLTAIEQTQANMGSNIQALNTQMANMSASLNDIATRIATLNNTMAALNEKLDAQVREIQQLTQVKKRKPTIRYRSSARIGQPPTSYYIQAVIPGRAWLISSNGATLTVREGTPIAGYGVVKLIDPEQGKVITSSGRTIRFSQVDS